MSKELLIQILPWILSANTLYVMFLAGNKRKYAWLMGLAGQLLWLVWIVLVQAWGLLPMNIGLWVIYGRNHLKWTAKSIQKENTMSKYTLSADLSRGRDKNSYTIFDMDTKTIVYSGDDMKRVNAWWYNKRFNFAYWLLGAKSMKVTRRK